MTESKLKNTLESLLNELKAGNVSEARFKEIKKIIDEAEIDKSAEITAIIEEIKKIMAGRGLATQ